VRVATIDIGTNTTLLLVAEKEDDGSLVALEEHATITRLGEGVDKTRTLAPAAVARTTACLDRYAEIVARLEAERVAVVGTSAMRDAGGGDAVRAHVKARFGVEARTISGDEEARLTFLGALSGIPQARTGERVCVFDIGGGSTEIVYGHRASGAIAYAHSFDVGSVRLTERHVANDPPSNVELEVLREASSAAFASVPDLAIEAAPVGIAGTMTTLAAVAMKMERYDGGRVHGSSLHVDALRGLVMELARLPLEERARVPGLEPKRADVIVAGGILALTLLAKLRTTSVTVSDRGVRWGLADELTRC
jgi:exopolyphosphatase / guanosine-5'-triphosphate,3'-diphosphate pyrophosphatase